MAASTVACRSSFPAALARETSNASVSFVSALVRAPGALVSFGADGLPTRGIHRSATRARRKVGQSNGQHRVIPHRGDHVTTAGGLFESRKISGEGEDAACKAQRSPFRADRHCDRACCRGAGSHGGRQPSMGHGAARGGCRGCSIGRLQDASSVRRSTRGRRTAYAGFCRDDIRCFARPGRRPMMAGRRGPGRGGG